MATSSNLYAEKVFAEHPIALWALDDQCDYISLISEAKRNFNIGTWTNTDLTIGGWTNTGASNTSVDLTIVKAIPFTNSTVQKWKNSSGTTVSFESSNLISSLDLDQTASTFSVGFYFYYSIQNIKEITISYKLNSGSYTDKTITEITPNQWSFISNTFTPTFPSGFFTGANNYINIKITVNLNTSTTTPFAINGLSIGQQAEEFHNYSLGITPITIPTNIPIKTQKGVLARAYGENTSSGYYLINDNKILAKNNSIPLIYGAKNLTEISANTQDEPSLIIPGKGFLNQIGQYGTYTLESWIRINSYTLYPKRILGPISSTDGLYVDGPFLTLKVGQYSGSHYINEWYRPMLLHICYSPNLVSLMINGETVFSINIDVDKIYFPTKTDTDNLIDQDWIGIYLDSSVPQIEVDCLGIYPYKVPPKVAKRRWIFGQAVDFPENINTAYSGKSVYIDYPFANYSKNYLYPDIGKWNQGLLENISTEKQNLSPKSYDLPKFVFSNQTTSTESAWFKDLSSVVTSTGCGITMKPNSSWTNISSYMYFNKLNVTGDNISAVYGVFQIIPGQTTQTLIRIEDQLTGEYLSIESSGNEYVAGGSSGYSISYIFNSASTNNVPVTLYKDDLFFTDSTNPFYSGSEALTYAGINFNDFANAWGSGLSKFLGNRERLSVYVGGNKDFQKTFNGYVYRIGFCTPRNFNKISSLFNNSGVVKQDNDIYGSAIRDGGSSAADATTPINSDNTKDNAYAQIASPFFDHIASYTLYPKMHYDSFVIDIATDCYWEDYVPLSYFGKNVENASGTEFSLDMIQFNIDFPKPIKKIIGNSSRYQTDNAIIKTYVSFQDLTTTTFNFKTSFANTSSIISQNQLIAPGAEYTTTRYEVINGSIINVPSTITDFNNFAIVIHVEMVVDGINSKPIKIKKLQLAGNTFGSLASGEIGTRFGLPLFPYKKEDGVYKYDLYNSFAISKFTKPYLYLTRDSGIQPLTTNSDRGISLSLNSELSADFALSALQITFRFEDSDFESGPTQFAELDVQGSTVKFFFTKVETGRAKITAIRSGLTNPGVVFYINGNYASDPVININQWTILGIGFINTFDFKGFAGNLNITYPIVVNNISYYEETVLQKITAGSNRQWFGVKFGLDSIGDNLFEWEDWKNKESVVVTAATIISGTPDKIEYTYTAGTKTVKVGERISVTGILPIGFNVVNAEVTDATATTFKVVKPAGLSSFVSATSAKAYTYGWIDVLVIAASTYLGADLGQLYSSYTGTNRFSVGDAVNLFVNKYQYSIYQDVNSVSKIIKPL